MIKSGVALLFLLISCCVQAQQDPVLMRINGQEVLCSEFEYFYNRGDSLIGGKGTSLNKYVDQFVNFKLKVAAAEAVGLDTTRSFRENISEYRRQLAKSYLTDSVVREYAARQMYDKMKENHHAWRIEASQIFKYLPQSISNSSLREVESRMDSIYKSLEDNAASFDACVKLYSDEKKPFWVSWLQMPIEFEDVAFTLNKGEISRPFFTPEGIHIVKIVDREEIPPFEVMKRGLLNKQIHCLEMDEGTEVLVEKLKKEYQYTPNEVGISELFTKGVTDETLFILGGKEYSGKDFERFKATHSAGLRRLLEEFVTKSVLDYENERLEQKYPEFRFLMKKYRDDTLLLAITGQKVLEPAKLDKEGLNDYFKQHRSNYYWKTVRYRGIVLHCVTKRIAKRARKMLKALSEKEWQNAIRLIFNKEQVQVQFEEGLFAPGDNEYVDDFIFKKKQSKPLLSFPFTVLRGEKEKGPRSSEEVGGRLIFDYQNYLESSWTDQLKAASKVQINQEVLKTVNNH